MPFDADAIPRGERKSNELIPHGARVCVRVESAVETLSKASGNPMVDVRLRVEGGPHSGASIFEHHTLSGKGAVYLADLSRAVGCPRWQHAHELERRACEVEVKVEESAGYAPRNRVAKYVGAVAAVAAVVDDTDGVPF